MTTREYLQSDETNRPRELSYGILREPPVPFFSHQHVVLKIARLLADYVEAAKLGAIGVAPLVDTAAERITVVDFTAALPARRSFARPDVVVSSVLPGFHPAASLLLP